MYALSTARRADETVRVNQDICVTMVKTNENHVQKSLKNTFGMLSLLSAVDPGLLKTSSPPALESEEPN